MASTQVSDAVDAYLTANFSTLPVRKMNENLEPPRDKSAFVQVQYPLALEDQKSIGAPGTNWFREEGAIRLVIAVPVGSGLTTARAVGDELRSLFRNKLISGVRTFEAQPVTFDDESDKGGYVLASVTISYEFDLSA